MLRSLVGSEMCIRDRRDIDPEQLFVFGRSLGGAVAIGLLENLGEQQARLHGMILENTFTSVGDMTESLWAPLRHIKMLFKQQWNSARRIADIECKIPLLFVSGLADELVPSWMMQHLFETASSNCDFKHMVRFPYGTHNETWCEGGYYQHLLMFIKKIYLKARKEEFTAIVPDPGFISSLADNNPPGAVGEKEDVDTQDV
eukprot:TRINITY_DN13873_c0_g1_i5.p1 TRINITY_DN13873_c0_g1~~TRINITY_DN13873_c0_g1_i5.p1  ORF type:complete len:201 (+),score=63.30 TRINITY_DN13873_c0_g1_i5:115-717(+)